jgi:hypothetical protein
MIGKRNRLIIPSYTCAPATLFLSREFADQRPHMAVTTRSMTVPKENGDPDPVVNSPLILSFPDVDFRERDGCLALATLMVVVWLVTYTEQHSQTTQN